MYIYIQYIITCLFGVFTCALASRLSMPLPEVTVDPDMIQVAGGVNSKVGSFSLQLSSPKSLPIRHQQKVALYMKTAISWFCPPNTSTLECHWLFVGESVSLIASWSLENPRGYNRIHPTYWVTWHGEIQQLLSKDAPEDHSCWLPRLLIPEKKWYNCITVRCSNYTDEWWKPVVFFFGVKPCLFLKWTFFLFFSWWMQPIKRSFYNPATWAIKQLPSKQTQESGTTSIFHTKKYALKKHTSQTSQTHNVFFWEAFYHGIHRISPPKKNTPKKNYPSRHHFYFRPNKNPSQSFLSSDISSKETSPDSSERGGWSATQKISKKTQQRFFSLQANHFQKDQIFPPRKSHKIFFFQGVATRWAPSSYR